MARTAKLLSALNRIRCIQDNIGFHTADDSRDEYAALNLMNGQPAFCSTAGYSNAPGSSLACAANQFASIEAGQNECADQFVNNGRNVNAAEWLDVLLPLNMAAVQDLQAAYERAGTFRTRRELLARTERHEFKFAMGVAAE